MADSTNAAPIDPVQQVLQVAGGYILSGALNVITEAGVPDQLEKGPRTAADLAKLTKTNEDALYRLMRALAGVGVFEETAPRTFALTPISDILRKGHPRSVRDIITFISDPFHFRVYANLNESLRTGKPAGEKTVGMPVFEYFGKNPEYSEVFNRAMTNMSAAVIPAALEAYDFGGIQTLVDVAGGHGEVLISILRKYPQLKGVLMDLGHVIAGAQKRLPSTGVQDRLQTVAGDFFKTVPRGDAYIMKHIIHDWDDARAAQILTNIRTAMGDTRGKVILLEGVISEGNAIGKLMDIEMLALPGGRERTKEEFQSLFNSAGFELKSITPTKSPVCVIEAQKI
jgi:hypothetical protein